MMRLAKTIFPAMLIAALAAPTVARAAEGEEIYTLVLVERLEYQSGEGDPLLLWDAQGWAGYDYDKLWIKTEGEYFFEGGGVGEAELQGLYSRAVGRFWDVQAGVRHDFEPDPSRSFGVLGFQGLAPYWFELDAALFVSENADVEARIEAEYDVLVTQRLIAQPRTELNFALQDEDRYGIGAGLSTAELGLRLRYEIRREFAPYIGISWTRAVGGTADFARAAGDDAGKTSFVAGIRLWF